MAAHLIEFAKRASSKVTRSLQVYTQMEAAQMGSVRMRSLTPILFIRYGSSFGGGSKRPPRDPVDKKLIYDVVKRKKKTQTSIQKQKIEEPQNWFSRMKNVTDAMRQQSRTKNAVKARQKYYPVSATDTYKDWARMSEARGAQTMRDEPVHVVINNKLNKLKSAHEIALASVKQCSKSDKANIKPESGKLGLKGDKKSQERPVPETRLAKEMDDWLKENRSMLEKLSAVQNAALKLNESIFTKKPLESTIGNPRRSPKSAPGSTAPKAPSGVFGMPTSGSRAGKDVGEINAEISRLRHDKNVEKDSRRFMNETHPREEKGANELLEIRPRYVETIEDVPSKPRSKKSSSSATELSTSKRNVPAREAKSSTIDLNINPTAMVKTQLSRGKEKGGGLDEARKMASVKNGTGMALNKDAQAENKGFVLVGEANAEKTFGKNKNNFVLHDNPHVKKAEREKASSSKSETLASSRSGPLKQRSQSFANDLKINPRPLDVNGMVNDIVKQNTEEAFNSFSRTIDSIGKDLKGAYKKVNVFDAVGRSGISEKGGKGPISCAQVSNNSNVSPRRKDSPSGAPVTVSNFKTTNCITNSPVAAGPSNKPGADQNALKANELKDRLNDRILSHYRLTSIKNDKSVSLRGDKPVELDAGILGQNEGAALAPRGVGESAKASKSINDAVPVDSKAFKSPKPIIDMMTGIQSKALDQFIKDGEDAGRGGAIQKRQNVAGKTPKVPELKPEVKQLKKKQKKTKQTTCQPSPSRSEPQLRVKPEEVATSLVQRERSAPDRNVQLYNAPRGSSAKKSVPASKFGAASNRNVSGEPSPNPNTVDIGDEELWSAMVRNRMSNYERLSSSPKSGPSDQSPGSKPTTQTNSSHNFPQSTAEVSTPSYNNASSINSSRTKKTDTPSKTKTSHPPKPVAKKNNQELIQSIRDQWGEDLRIKYPNLDKFVSRLRSNNARTQTAQNSEKNCNSGVQKGTKPSGELFTPYNHKKYKHGLNTIYQSYKSSETPQAVNPAENTSSNARGDLTPPSTCTSGSKAPEVISSKSSIFSSHHGDRKAAVRTKGSAAKPQVRGNYKIVPLEEWMKTREGLIAEKMSQEISSTYRQHNLPRPGKSSVCDSDQCMLGLSASPSQSERHAKRYGKKSSERRDHRDQMLKPKESQKPSAAARDMYKDICETYMKAGGGASRSGRGVAPLAGESGALKSGSCADPRPRGVWSADRTPRSAASSHSIMDVDSVLSQMQLNETHRSVQSEQDRVDGARENPNCASPRKLFRGFDGMMDMTVSSAEDCSCRRGGRGQQMTSPRSACRRQPYSGDLCARYTERSPRPNYGYDESNVPDANLRDILAAKRRRLALEAQKELIHRCEDNIRKHESALERYRALLSMAQEEGIDILNGGNSKRR